MATLKLENLSSELLSQIEHLAQQNHCTVNQQAIALIQKSLNQLSNKDSSWSKRRKAVPHIQAEIDRQTRVNPADFGLPDSTPKFGQLFHSHQPENKFSVLYLIVISI